MAVEPVTLVLTLVVLMAVQVVALEDGFKLLVCNFRMAVMLLPLVVEDKDLIITITNNLEHLDLTQHLIVL